MPRKDMMILEFNSFMKGSQNGESICMNEEFEQLFMSKFSSRSILLKKEKIND